MVMGYDPDYFHFWMKTITSKFVTFTDMRIDKSLESGPASWCPQKKDGPETKLALLDFDVERFVKVVYFGPIWNEHII
jgi:hypothetical protein